MMTLSVSVLEVISILLAFLCASFLNLCPVMRSLCICRAVYYNLIYTYELTSTSKLMNVVNGENYLYRQCMTV